MLCLDSVEKEMLAGARGAAAQFAMETMVAVAEMYSAPHFVDIESAHVASAYCNGQANIDFARRLRGWNAKVAVPTTLMACSFDPRSQGIADSEAVVLVDAYREMGCDPVLSCAPYQARPEPAFGAHVAWCESSAVTYANSVLGARTNCYVEFIDMCAAITGRVPACGLHDTARRGATMVFALQDIPKAWFDGEWLMQSLGILIGRRSGAELPAITGLPEGTTNDQLRALGSAAASAGSVSMFHAVGVTPEAPTLDAACQSVAPVATIPVCAEDIERTATELCSASNEPVSAVCIGAPHSSAAELCSLAQLLDGRMISPRVKFIAATSTAVLGDIEDSGVLAELIRAGVDIVVGRCTYYRPLIADLGPHVMTNSAKWAWYGPSNLDVAVTFASLSDCVERACHGG